MSIGSLISEVPTLAILLIYLVGLVLCLTRWQRHPAIAGPGTIAFSLFLGCLLAARGLWWWKLWIIESKEFATGSSVTTVDVLLFILPFVNVAAWILLLVALSANRKTITA